MTTVGTAEKPAQRRGRKPWIVPIPGTTKSRRLRENLGAVDIDLTPDETDALTKGADRITVHAPKQQQLVNR